MRMMPAQNTASYRLRSNTRCRPCLRSRTGSVTPRYRKCRPESSLQASWRKTPAQARSARAPNRTLHPSTTCRPGGTQATWWDRFPARSRMLLGCHHCRRPARHSSPSCASSMTIPRGRYPGLVQLRRPLSPVHPVVRPAAPPAPQPAAAPTSTERPTAPSTSLVAQEANPLVLVLPAACNNTYQPTAAAVVPAVHLETPWEASQRLPWS